MNYFFICLLLFHINLGHFWRTLYLAWLRLSHRVYLRYWILLVSIHFVNFLVWKFCLYLAQFFSWTWIIDPKLKVVRTSFIRSKWSSKLKTFVMMRHRILNWLTINFINFRQLKMTHIFLSLYMLSLTLLFGRNNSRKILFFCFHHDDRIIFAAKLLFFIWRIFHILKVEKSQLSTAFIQIRLLS